MRAFLLSAAVFLAPVAGPVAAQDAIPDIEVLPYEMAIAEREAGRLRGLAQRLSKQNLLYQLHLGETSKDGMMETAREIDRTLQVLRSGNTAYSIPAPWTPKIESQLDQVDAVWSSLRPIATASAFDYLRRSRRYMSPEARRGDPLSIRYFDSLSDQFAEEAEKLLGLYFEDCKKTGFEQCLIATQSGVPAGLTHRMIKEAVLLAAGFDSSTGRKRLDESRGAFDEQWDRTLKSSLVAYATDPSRGPQGEFVTRLLENIQGDWQTLRKSLDIAVTGDEQLIDVDGLLRIESRLIQRLERLNATLTRYAIVRYAT